MLGTGGTIAGTSAGEDSAYVAAQLTAADLLRALPEPPAADLEVEQVAQLDSKDMDHASWQRLARRVAHHLARDDVAGLVVTHGTDTLEETAYFLQRLLAPSRPVVLTAAMRPATSAEADGPRNLADAIRVAAMEGAQGVVAVMAGEVHAAFEVRKQHSHRIAGAFGSGDRPPLGRVRPDAPALDRPWPAGEALGLARIALDPDHWPQVDIVTSHAGADGRIVNALVAGGVDGIVAAGTGNGTIGHRMEAALRAAETEGVAVVRATRCADGGIVDARPEALASAGPLSAVQARIELMLALMKPR